MTINPNLAAGAVIAGAIVYVISKLDPDALITGAGKIVGIPETNKSKCDAAKKSGKAGDVSFYCSAGDALEWATEQAKNKAKKVVIKSGEMIGIPQTNAKLCNDAKNRGDGWAASKYCAADDFIEWQAGRVKKKVEDIFK